MRIVDVASPKLFSRGASAIEVVRMAQAMGEAGHDVELIVSGNTSSEEIAAFYGVEPRFELTTLPAWPGGTTARHTLHALAAYTHLRRRRGHYDVAFTRNLPFAWLSASRLRIPTVYAAHHPLTNFVQRRLLGAAARSGGLSLVAAISEAIADTCIKAGVPRERVKVVPNGVDTSLFDAAPPKSEARRLLGLPPEKKIVSHIGNIYEGRGLDLLAGAARRFPEALFIQVGGEERDIERYRRLAARQGAANMEFTGFVPPRLVPLYYAASDCLVLPYTSSMTTKSGRVEAGTASLLKLAEYMAAARPIVATCIPAVSYALRDGENAVVVEPDSTEALVRGLETALTNEELGAAIAARARRDAEAFSLQRRVEAILGPLGSEVVPAGE